MMLNSGVAGLCGPGRIRTCDTRFRKPLLYPLSYGADDAPSCLSAVRRAEAIWSPGNTCPGRLVTTR
jgi:hypothetical protein